MKLEVSNQKWDYVGDMPRTNMDGQSIRRVLGWLLNRGLADADLAAALEMPSATFSRRKDHDDFPTYEELERLGTAFGIDARMLQIAFGYRQLDELILLDEDAMRQYLRQGLPGDPFSTIGGFSLCPYGSSTVKS
jgi:hypothetical protein